ncbi:hypothetical protein AVEN_257362-1 [Araneus ventricosus]|uniref:Uncharacterized protein n=1 Tax=Araneus ventricosus TaxID=182803 RepID=A0A4Y2C949_ARAVE|nr:hypothetical protein AVEN_257362-1 [Araneus ventricosus]
MKAISVQKDIQRVEEERLKQQRKRLGYIKGVITKKERYCCLYSLVFAISDAYSNASKHQRADSPPFLILISGTSLECAKKERGSASQETEAVILHVLFTGGTYPSHKSIPRRKKKTFAESVNCSFSSLIPEAITGNPSSARPSLLEENPPFAEKDLCRRLRRETIESRVVRPRATPSDRLDASVEPSPYSSCSSLFFSFFFLL